MSPRVSLQGHTNEWRGLTTTLSATESWWQIKDSRDTETRILLSQTEYEIRSFLPSSRWLLSYLLVLQVTAVCSWPRSVSDCHLTAGHFPTHILPMCQTEESWCTQLLPAWMSTISQDPSLLKPSSHRPKTEAWKFILKSKLFPPCHRGSLIRFINLSSVSLLQALFPSLLLRFTHLTPLASS